LSQGCKTGSGWIDDGLEDDVATLSYERALQAHARPRLADASDYALTQAAAPQSIRNRGSAPQGAAAFGKTKSSGTGVAAGEEAESETFQDQSAGFEKNLKSASITIRLSKTECAQLRCRAVEAGLTLSGYMRSCTFEAESLRAQVKEALAQLRTGESKEKTLDPAPNRRSLFHWPWRALRLAKSDAESCCVRR
jgi:hypothetical protein